MKVKKILSMLLVCLVATGTLAGCGSDAKSSGGKTADKEITTLKWYTIGQEPIDKDLVVAEANKYLGEKIGVNIDMNFIDYGDYTQKMSVIMNTGENYDLAFTCSWAGDYLGNARKGAFIELDPYLDNIGKDMKDEIDQRFWDGAKVDGKTYAVPNQKEIATAPMWVFTKEYIDKYDIPHEELKTLEDLEPWLKVIKENEPDVVPLYITGGFTPPLYFDLLVEPAGVEYNQKDLKIKNLFETKDMKKTLETLNRYYDLGYINPDSSTAKTENTRKRFVTKADGQPYAEQIWTEELGFEVVATQIMDSYITNGSTTGSMIGVSKVSKNPEKSVEFLNFLNTDEYIRNLLNFGIEGTHYTKNDEGKVTLTQKADNYSVPYYTLGNLFITHVFDSEPLTKWDEFKEFNNAAKESIALGFKFNAESVSNQVAAINNVLEEFKTTVYSGSVDNKEYLAKFNSKLKEQGLDDIMVEMQKQIDEWGTNNK
ncbi:ABC transporter substrate-binding protein [uncultured Clostridium sp.]|uniref:ABC transporter substrate-binding protein n=1 Tax=uncultured Clostridium sp. TaxID=59620 RepID=UPI00260CBC4D|nr:ABC transporter substrate-binding protein [uncultured Clostridium sp.]